MEQETTTTESTQSFETPSFGAALKGAMPGGKKSEPIEAKTESPTPEPVKTESQVTATEATPAKPAESAASDTETVKTEAATPPAAESADQNPRMVPVSALQAEREKRQAVEALLAERDALIPAAEPESTQEVDPATQQYQRMWDPLESTCRHASLSIL